MDTLHDILHSLINHFVPHEGNDYRPHLLQRGAMILMLILIMLSFLVANFQALVWQSSDWLMGAVLPAVVVDLTNAARADLALPKLTRSPVLDEVANLKAQDMARYSYFSHDSPTGVTPWYWFKEAGYSFVYAGENLAVYFSESSEVVDAWMNSPTHRANIVGNQYREIGVGVARGTYKGLETVFVVQMFGTPAAIPMAQEAVPLPEVVAAPFSLAVATEQTNSTTVGTEITPVTPLVAGEMSANNPELDVVVIPNESVPDSMATVVAPLSEAVTTEETSLSMATPASVFAQEAKTVMGSVEAISLYSDMAASSSNLLPAPYKTIDLETEASSKVAVLATEPSKLLQLIYLVLGSVTALVLLLSVLLEWRHHRPVQTAYGIGLLLIMAGLFYVHTTIVAGAIIL